MKKLIAFLALAMAANVAYADGAEVTHNAEMRMRYVVDMEKDATESANSVGSENMWNTRVLWGTTFRAGEALTGNLTLVHNADWGHSNAFDSGATAGTATGDSGLGKYDGTSNGENMLLVNEANVAWQASDELMLLFGRTSFDIGNGKIVSSNDYEKVKTAFEGGLAAYDTEFAKFALFGVKFAEWDAASKNLPTSSDAEVNAWGLSVDFKTLPDFFKVANIHVIQLNKDEVDTTGDNNAGTPANATEAAIESAESRMRYGLTLAGDTAGIDYDFTYAAHTGEFRYSGAKADRAGNMMDIELGYSMPDTMNLRVYLGYHSDTGDDNDANNGSEEYDSFFYNMHDNAGKMDVMRWGNLTHTQVGVTFSPMDTIDVGVSYHMFTATEKGGNTNTSTKWVRDTNKDDLGNEIDLEANKSYGDNLSIGTRYSQFAPGDGFKVKDTYSQLWFQGKVNF